MALNRELGNRLRVAECLEGLARAAAVRGPARAARLWGAAAALREELGAPLPPNERTRYEGEVAAAQALGDDAAFEQAWREGRAMPLARAIELAMEQSGC